MKSQRSKNIIIAVLISAALLLSNSVQAASLLALDGNPAAQERQIGLFERVAQWLNGAWGDLTSVFAFSEEAPPPPSGTECTQNCDAGPGIDPMG